MPYLYWFVIQRFLAGLLAFPLLDVFTPCDSMAEAWEIFRTLNTTLQVGVITITLTLAFVVGETIFFLGRTIRHQWRNWGQDEPSSPSPPNKPKRARRSSIAKQASAKRPPRGRSLLPRRSKQAAKAKAAPKKGVKS